MIPFALSAGRWLLSGGWKYASMGLLALAVLFYRAESQHQARRADAAEASIPTWKFATDINLASVKMLTRSLNDQSAHVHALADEGQRKQNAAQTALRAAQGRAQQAEGLADRIDAERAHWASLGCTSGAAVMAAKGSL